MTLDISTGLLLDWVLPSSEEKGKSLKLTKGILMERSRCSHTKMYVHMCGKNTWTKSGGRPGTWRMGAPGRTCVWCRGSWAAELVRRGH